MDLPSPGQYGTAPSVPRLQERQLGPAPQVQAEAAGLGWQENGPGHLLPGPALSWHSHAPTIRKGLQTAFETRSVRVKSTSPIVVRNPDRYIADQPAANRLRYPLTSLFLIFGTGMDLHDRSLALLVTDCIAGRTFVAEMLGLDPDDNAVRDMLSHYRMLFSREPNVNGRQKEYPEGVG